MARTNAAVMPQSTPQVQQWTYQQIFTQKNCRAHPDFLRLVGRGEYVPADLFNLKFVDLRENEPANQVFNAGRRPDSRIRNNRIVTMDVVARVLMEQVDGGVGVRRLADNGHTNLLFTSVDDEVVMTFLRRETGLFSWYIKHKTMDDYHLVRRGTRVFCLI